MTLEKIASLAKVSRSTVSRVINNDPNVSEATRIKVKQVIEQINYQPNIAARRLAGGRTRTIGLLVPMGVSTIFTDPFFSFVIQGVSAACNDLDHYVMLWLAEPEYERRSIRQFLNNRLVDGVIIASMLTDDPLLQAMIDADLPFIMVGRYLGSDDVSYVDVDNQSAAANVISYLASLGYTRIATITGPHNMIAGLDRLEGYQAGMREHGLPIEAGMVVEADFTEQGGYAAMQRLLPEKPEAVFAASDVMAVGAMRAVRDAGLCIPEDIGMVGFDDMPIAASSNPPLTTVRQPVHLSGETAARTLIRMINGASVGPHHIVLPTELIARSSCRASKPA